MNRLLQTNRVLIIRGAPGCGKSTRAPPALLAASARIIVSQPRRVAAESVAARVSTELGEEVGETAGYQMRLRAKLPRHTGSILYCTSGILLRKLQSDPTLSTVSHVMIDEAHERDISTDLCLMLLRRSLSTNQRLRIVIMSATLDSDVFQKYFDNCPVLDVPGRNFPVENIYLEDMSKKLGINLEKMMEISRLDTKKPNLNIEEIVKIILAIDEREEPGGILVFLPGWAEIKQAMKILQELPAKKRYVIVPVHSKLSITDQSKMLIETSKSARKIVLATNIAETSITIPDITCVLDAGACRTTKLGRGSTSLELCWVSQASAEQRQGRAGRVRPGRCYKLYTREKESTFLEQNIPEILRVPLDRVILDMKAYFPTSVAEDLLSQLPQPVSRQAVATSVTDLVDLGALSEADESITPLGEAISLLPLPPRLALSLIHAAILKTAAAISDVVGACASGTDFASGSDGKEIRDIKACYHTTSDFEAFRRMHEKFTSLDDEEKDVFCESLGINKQRLLDLQALSIYHLEQLMNTGILGSNPDVTYLDANGREELFTTAILLSGLETVVIGKTGLKTKGRIEMKRQLFTSLGQRAHISSESVNSKNTNKNSIFLYHGGLFSKERSSIVIKTTASIGIGAVLIFTKNAIIENSTENWTTILLPRHNLKVLVDASQVGEIMKLRAMLWNTFQYFVEKGDSLEENILSIDFRENLTKTLIGILKDENMSRNI